MSKKFYSGGYYFENKENPRILVATYDLEKAQEDPEHPTWGWFRPYGDMKLSPGPEDILHEKPVQFNGTSGKVYYKVALAVDFMEQFEIVPIIAGPKHPLFVAGWAPYGSDNMYYEQLQLFSLTSSIGSAIKLITSAGQDDGNIKNACNLLASAKAQEDNQKFDEQWRQARAILKRIVTDGESPEIANSIKAAAPPKCVEPDRFDDEMDMSADDVWRYRLLCNVVYGMAYGGIAQ